MAFFTNTKGNRGSCKTKCHLSDFFIKKATFFGRILVFSRVTSLGFLKNKYNISSHILPVCKRGFVIILMYSSSPSKRSLITQASAKADSHILEQRFQFCGTSDQFKNEVWVTTTREDSQRIQFWHRNIPSSFYVHHFLYDDEIGVEAE